MVNSLATPKVITEKGRIRKIQNITIIANYKFKYDLDKLFTHVSINEQFNYWLELKGKIYSHPDNDKRGKIS